MVVLAEEEKRFDERSGHEEEQLMIDNLSFPVPSQHGPIAAASTSRDIRMLEQKLEQGMPRQHQMQKKEAMMEAWQSPAAVSHSLGPRKGQTNKGSLREYVLFVLRCKMKMRRCEKTFYLTNGL